MMEGNIYKEKKEQGYMKGSNELLKKQAHHNESRFKKFCGDTNIKVDVPNINESLKFLKHDVDNSILNFQYNTMILNEKIERLNDIERQVCIPMHLPISYSINIEENEDINNWINKENMYQNEKQKQVEKITSEENMKEINKINDDVYEINNINYIGDMNEYASVNNYSKDEHDTLLKIINNKNLSENLKDISSNIPYVSCFEKDDIDLLNITIPEYIKNMKNKKNKLNNNTKDKIFIEQSSDDLLLEKIDSANSKKKYLNYNHFFRHPILKNEKIKNIYPIVPYISVWENKYIQGIMDIESDTEQITTSGNQTNKSNDNKFYGLLHLIQKSRDKHIYSLYKKKIKDEKEGTSSYRINKNPIIINLYENDDNIKK